MKSKTKKLIPAEFFWAFLCTAFGLTIYILGKKVIPFPEQWMGAQLRKSIFFLGVSSHLTVSWFLNVFFMFFDQEKQNQEKIQKIRNNLTKALTLLFFVGTGLLTYWESLEGNLANISFLILILIVINCCINAIIQFMNKYGICSGFNLLLFIEFLPVRWLAWVFWPNVQSNWQTSNFFEGGLLKQPWFCVILLLIVTVFFVWLINIKWETPVETNTSFFAGNPLVKKKRFPLGFRANFNFWSLFQLSQVLRLIYFLIKLVEMNNSFSSISNLTNNWGKISTNLQANSIIWKGEGEKKWESFFLLNNKKNLFGELFSWISEKKWVILLILLFLLFLRWLSTWLATRKIHLSSKEISKRLQRRGIYLNNIPPGDLTRNLLRKIVNYLVIYWIMVVIVFNIIFDQIFANLEKEKVAELSQLNKEEVVVSLGTPRYTFFTSFIDWFASVGIGIDLYRQIKTKYKYTQRKSKI